MYADQPNFCFSLNGAASCRPTVSKLSMLTGARCLSIQYRLAPQNPFPAALLDVFLVYLSLLNPAPGSFHEPVEASSIVFAGDSAGASLCVSMIQVMLELKRETVASSIRFHNRTVAVQMPAGLTLLSVAGEMVQALPSWMENGQYDILRDVPPTAQPDFPKDSLWPSDPPRADPFCHDSALCHPLISPATAVSWAGAPPMWIACGQERLADSAKVIARTAAQDGVCIFWEQYQSMPHTWAQIFPRWPQSIRCFESWAKACKQFGEGGKAPKESYGIYIKSEDGKVENLKVQELTSLTPVKALEIMNKKCREMELVTKGKCLKASL